MYFRSCKYDITLSQDALNMLKAYLSKNGHVLLIQVLQTWFHIDINNDPNKNNAVSIFVTFTLTDTYHITARTHTHSLLPSFVNLLRL